MSDPSPAHRLGPHVVGQRVVVRRLVPGETGPTGGPAFTDVLGICTAWGPFVAMIETDSGPVEIPLTLVVSGKPVPPRPSVRMRVGVREAELHTARLEAGVVTQWLGEWQLTHEPDPVGRVRGRFNSCLAMGDPGMPLTDALAEVVGHFRALDRIPYLRVDPDSEIAAAATAAGWRPVPEKDAAFWLGSVAQVRRRLARGASVRPVPIVTAEESYATAVLAGAARGRAAIDGDWLGVHGLEVAPERRREGLGTAIMAALAGWGAERGARTLWLHVEVDNPAALALYEGLGLVEHHRCRYLIPPA